MTSALSVAAYLLAHEIVPTAVVYGEGRRLLDRRGPVQSWMLLVTSQCLLVSKWREEAMRGVIDFISNYIIKND